MANVVDSLIYNVMKISLNVGFHDRVLGTIQMGYIIRLQCPEIPETGKGSYHFPITMTSQ